MPDLYWALIQPRQIKPKKWWKIKIKAILPALPIRKTTTLLVIIPKFQKQKISCGLKNFFINDYR